MAKITTVEEALNAVREDGSALKDVPEKFKTAEVCLAAVKQQSSYYNEYRGSVSSEIYAYNYVPWGQLDLTVPATAEICLEAMKLHEHPLSLSEVPENAKTAEVCLEAVKRYGSELKYVPEKLKTVELCLESVKHRDAPPSFIEPNWDRFAYVPEKLRDEVRRRYESGK